jgi:hypothetical protein
MTKVKTCEVNKIKTHDLPCFNRAKHTLKIYHKDLGKKMKMKLAICDLHYDLIEQHDRLGNDIDVIKVKETNDVSKKYGAVLIKGRLP